MSRRKPVEVFDDWAKQGKDEGMESGHAAAVGEMLALALSKVAELGKEFSAIDAGCGNGWVVRDLAMMPLCRRAIGVDGAESMIKKAKEIDPDGEYHHADLQEWRPENPVDLVHSMEVFYYVEDTNSLLIHIAAWLKPDGYLIFGVDRYMENPESHDWDSQVGCFMALLSEDEWSKVVTDAGFSIIKRWRAAPDPSRDWPGTLAFLCINEGH